jgi:hypothetical protein
MSGDEPVAGVSGTTMMRIKVGYLNADFPNIFRMGVTIKSLL